MILRSQKCKNQLETPRRVLSHRYQQRVVEEMPEDLSGTTIFDVVLTNQQTWEELHEKVAIRTTRKINLPNMIDLQGLASPLPTKVLQEQSECHFRCCRLVLGGPLDSLLSL